MYSRSLLFIVFVICLLGFVYSASRCASSDNCCTVGSTCPTCSATTATTQRIRKDVRSLTTAEFNAFAAALNVMKKTSQTDGVAKYGSMFKNYDYFVAKHLSACQDTRGN